MSRFLANPRTRRFAQRPIERKHNFFRRGVLRDRHPTDIPRDGLYDAANIHCYKDKSAEVRSGNERLADTQLPSLATGISASKSGTIITISAGYSPSSADVGRYFVWPDGVGENEYITNVSGNDLTVTSSSSHANCTTGKIREEVNAEIWDAGHSKWVILIGTKVYYAAWNLASWTEAYSLAVTAPADAKSVMRVYGDDVYLWNANGFYKIEMGATIPVVVALNNTMLERTIGDLAKTEDNVYGRRYITTMSEMSGSTLLSRLDSAQTVTQESGPSDFDADNRDYSEVFQEQAFGPEGEVYGVLTGGSLNASRDAPSEWAAISDGQCKFTVNEQTREIYVDFSGCTTMADVADRIEIALRDHWSWVTFEFDEDHFVLTAGNIGDTVDYATAGSAGTDISDSTYLNMRTGQGTLTTPDTYQSHEMMIGDWKEKNSDWPWDQLSYYAIFSYDDKLWLMGGLYKNDAGSTLYNNGVYYSDDDGATWTLVGSADWAARANMGYCVFDDKMWIVGGVGAGGTQYNDAWYSTDGDNWTQATSDGGASGSGDTWTARDGHSCAALGSKLYLVGGEDSIGDTDDVYSTTNGVDWTAETTDGDGGTWSARENFVLLSYAGKLWIIAGDASSTRQNDVYSSADGASWTQETAAADFTARWGVAGAVVGDRMWIMGGNTAVSTMASDVWYSDDGATWVEWGNAPWEPRYAHRAVAHNSALWIYGGLDALNNFIGEFWRAKESLLRTPNELSGSDYYYLNEYTHYSIYATEDTGENGVDPNTGEGNNPELYMLLDDVPIIKGFVVSTDAYGNVTASKGTFHEYDIGSILYLSDGSYGRIETFKGASKVIWNKTSVATSVGGAIGTTKAFVFDQSGQTVTATKGTPFDANSVGKRIFDSEGDLIVITGFTSSTVVTVADSATRSGLGGGILDSPTTDAYVNHRKYYDAITDEELATRVTQWNLKNRFWIPIPDCDHGEVVPGFFVSGVRDERKYYVTDLREPYLVGYYYARDLLQEGTLHDNLRGFRNYDGILAAFCDHSVTVFDTSVVYYDDTKSVGERIRFLGHKKTLDGSYGVRDTHSIVRALDGQDIVRTTEGEIRAFNGTSFGPMLGRDIQETYTQKLRELGSASYDPSGGYIRWGTESAYTNSSYVPFPDKVYRYATRDEEGVGGVQYTGDDFPRPPHGINGIEIVDGNGCKRQVVLDNKDGRHYWISTYTQSGASLTKRWEDKHDGSSGTEISAWLKVAHIGSSKHYDVFFDDLLLTLAPDDDGNADGTGYDSEGYRDGLEVDIDIYGSPDYQTAYASAADVTKDGDITVDERPAHRCHIVKISVNRSEVRFCEIVGNYSVVDQAAVPAKRAMTEKTYQSNISVPVLWLGRNSQLYRNLVDGSLVSSGSPTGVTGPDSKSNSGFLITSALSTISVSLTAGDIVLWKNGALSLTIGGDAIVLTEHGTHSGWSFCYARAVTKSGILLLTPTGSLNLFDLRVFSTAKIDANTRAYLYNDIVKNNGANTMRKF